MWVVVLHLLLLFVCVTPAFAEPGISEKYERDYNIFNPASKYAPDNPLNATETYAPDNPFNPANQYNPQNPLNPANRYNPNTSFEPLNCTR